MGLLVGLKQEQKDMVHSLLPFLLMMTLNQGIQTKSTWTLSKFSSELWVSGQPSGTFFYVWLSSGMSKDQISAHWPSSCCAPKVQVLVLYDGLDSQTLELLCMYFPLCFQDTANSPEILGASNEHLSSVCSTTESKPV